MKQNNTQSNYPSNASNPAQNQVEILTTAVPEQIDPALTKTLVDNGGLIALILALCWFFKILTRFVEACQKD